MTGRTHDLAAFTALNMVFLSAPLQTMSLATAVTAFGANFIGGLFPDIDQPTSDLWDNFRGGEIIGKYFCKFLGGHRHLSHSIVGVVLIGLIVKFFLTAINPIFLVDMNVVWWSFMIGVVSHLIMDVFTKDGMPLLWPIQWKIGFPPFKFLRIRTGKFVESSLVFPSLLIITAYLVFFNYHTYLDFFHNYIR